MTKEATMAERFVRLDTTRTTPHGKKYLLPPDHKDSRWGLQHFGGVEPITDKRAAKLLDEMEKWQAGRLPDCRCDSERSE